MRKLLFAFIAVLLGTIVSLASEIDGKWKTIMEGPNGSMELVFTFKVVGTMMTGTVYTPMGEMPISDGKFDGKQFSFNVEMNENTIKHEGTLDGDTLKMKVIGIPGGDGGDQDSREMDLKRSVE